jgi:hypothetical protein
MIKDPLSVVGAVIFLIGVTMMVVVIIGGAFRTNFWLGILATGFLLSGLGMVLVTGPPEVK